MKPAKRLSTSNNASQMQSRTHYGFNNLADISKSTIVDKSSIGKTRRLEAEFKSKELDKSTFKQKLEETRKASPPLFADKSYIKKIKEKWYQFSHLNLKSNKLLTVYKLIQQQYKYLDLLELLDEGSIDMFVSRLLSFINKLMVELDESLFQSS